jgi:hypothetical protein
MQVTMSDLYSEIVGQLQAAVQAAGSATASGTGHRDAGKEKSRLMQLAAQEESAGDAGAAKQHHTTLCALWKNDPQVGTSFLLPFPVLQCDVQHMPKQTVIRALTESANARQMFLR